MTSRTTRDDHPARRPGTTTQQDDKDAAVTDQPTGPVTLADIEAAREVLADIAVAHPDGGVALALRAGRRAGQPQVREPPAHRLLQDPRRLRADLPALRRGARRTASSPPAPATTPRASRWPRSMLGIRSTVFMPEGAPIPKEKATRGYGADVRFQGRYLEEALVAARRFAEETGAVLIHPFDHARHRRRAGHRRPRGPRAGARRPHRAGADRRRRAAGRHGDRDQGAAPRRTRGRGAGRGRRRLPRVVAGGRPGAAGSR